MAKRTRDGAIPLEEEYMVIIELYNSGKKEISIEGNQMIGGGELK